MSRIIKYLLIALGALLSLLLIVAGVVAATFNPNEYKPLVIKLVQEKKQRTLAIPGDIKLTFFPKIGADLGKVSISEHNSVAEFGSVNSARVSLELIPLLSKQLVVDHVRIDGLTASIKRFQDGTTNVDDLLSKEESGQQIKFNVDGISVTNAKILFDDQQRGRKIEIGNLNIETGKIANGVSSNVEITADAKSNNPSLDVRLAAKSGITIDVEQKHYGLKDVDAEIKGKLADFTDIVFKAGGDVDLKLSDMQIALDDIAFEVSAKQAGRVIEAKFDAPKLAMTDTRLSGGKLRGEAKLTEGTRTVTANFLMPSFDGSPQAFKLPSLALDVMIKDAQLDAKVKVAGAITGDIDKLLFLSPQLSLALEGKQGDRVLAGTLMTPLFANMKTQMVELSKIAAAFTLPNPAGGVLQIKADGNASLNLGKQNLSMALKGSVDDSSFDATLGLAKFSSPVYTFAVGIDHIDAGRYQAKPAAATTQAAAQEKPMDLSMLKNLNASGSLKIGVLKVENIKASNVRLDLRAAGGKVDINPLAANLYGGSVSGAMSVLGSSPPHFAVRQNLVGVGIGALLQDAIGKEPMNGKGNVQLDIATQGATFGQMKKALNGTVRLELRDGTVRGINVAQAVREAKAKIDVLKGGAAPQAGTGSSSEKTDFSELSGSFRIVNGVARNTDLSAKSPLIRVSGMGDINLGEDRLDYLAKATVVSTLQGQGGPELQALKGVTVPVNLSGPFTAIGWRIDFAGMAGELAKQKVDEKKEEMKAKLQDQLKDKLQGLLGK